MEIIGGPAIRRTENNAVYIWLVTDEKPSELIISISKNKSLSSPIAITKAPPSNIVKIGDKLFNCVVKVTPPNGYFPSDTKLFYNISIGDNNLKSLGLLSGKNSITYKNESFPSFIIPEKHTNILQGSCRKPHASNKSNYAQYDHMRTADKLISNSINNLSKRPTMICLTGDQIYADDVAVPLLCVLKEKAHYYLGWKEELPHPKVKNKVVVPHNLKVAERYKVLTKKIGFTSGETDNHLMTFGEFMMMYLVVWGGISVNLPSYKTIEDDLLRITKKRFGRFKYQDYKISKDEYDEQRSIVKSFLKNTHKTRRVMANITSYMMFDDHEVSDDWNLTFKNSKAFKTNPLSKRIQANALVAYWACQGWGNNPNNFNNNYKTIISNFLTTKTAKNGGLFDKEMGKQSWNYTVDGYPVLVALDTRTKRTFKGSKFSQLMSTSEINNLGKEIKRLNDKYKETVDQQSLLLLSPAPFLGFTLLERGQLAAKSMPTLVDGEPWIGSETAYKHMKKVLSTVAFGQCCIISGDVHYSFSRSMKLLRKNKTTLELFQITSSALHNAPGGTMRLILNGLSKYEKSMFNRIKTPYLYPVNETEFINGHTNISHLEYKLGRPVKNTYIFFNPNKRKIYKWVYNLKNYKTVSF